MRFDPAGAMGKISSVRLLPKHIENTHSSFYFDLQQRQRHALAFGMPGRIGQARFKQIEGRSSQIMDF